MIPLHLSFTTALEHPFPGLRPFQTHEAFLFFGRDEQTRQLLRRLGSHRLLAVVGSSGSGKSSLVRAGLIPALQIGHLAETGSRWRIAVMRPGAAPLDELASALHQAIGREGDTVARLRAEVGHTSLGLIQAVQERLDGTAQENLLVVVDQFEELFRFRREHEHEDGGAEASLYVTALLEAIDQFDVPMYVVLTMRSDFLGDCAQFPGLPEALNRSQYLIPRLTRDECREAIAGPLRIAGAAITPRLLERLLNESNEDPDRLPVLQHALAATFEMWKAEGRKGEFDLHHYMQAGGIGDALNRHAEAVYGDLPADLQVVAERVFRCLTTIDDGRPVRRPARLNRIYDVVGADDASARERVRGVVRRFSAAHNSFLAPVDPACPDDTVVDISHESLIRNWKRLHEWVRSEAESAEWYRSVASAAAKHRSGDAGLWRNPELSRAFAASRQDAWTPAWSARSAPGFDEAMAFLGESRRAQIRRTAAVLVAVVAIAGAAAGGFWKYRADIEQRDVQLVQERAQLADLQARVDEGQRAVDDLTSRLQGTQDATEKSRLEAMLAEREKQLEALRAQEASQKNSVTATQAQVDDPRVKTALAEIDRLQRDLAEARRERDDAVARQTNSADTGKPSQELQDARAQVVTLEKQVASLKAQLEARATSSVDQPAAAPASSSGSSPAARATDPIARSYPATLVLPVAGGIELLRVAAGPFLMGSDRKKDPMAVSDELWPGGGQGSVTLPDFYIGKYEVTVAQYKACVDAKGCSPGIPLRLQGNPDQPVNVDGWRVSLPSEAEWEKAARGSDGRTYPWGEGIDSDRANMGGKRSRPMTVGSFPRGASPYGVLDMSGNVWEWTRSLYEFYPYVPSDGREDLKASGVRVLRGGSFIQDANLLRAASRNGGFPRVS